MSVFSLSASAWDEASNRMPAAVIRGMAQSMSYLPGAWRWRRIIDEFAASHSLWLRPCYCHPIKVFVERIIYQALGAPPQGAKQPLASVGEGQARNRESVRYPG